MKAGDLKHRATLLAPEKVTDSRGNLRTTWAERAFVACAMWDVSARDYAAAMASQTQDTVTFAIRWRDDILPSWRIVQAGITYEIRQINHLGYKRDFIHIKARRLDKEG